MNMKAETFGEILSSFMQDRQSSPNAVCAALGIKSQTTLNRILRDESSPKKLASFLQQFSHVNPLGLSHAELLLLAQGLQVNAVGRSKYLIGREMLAFVQAQPAAPACICQQAYGVPVAQVRSLSQLFESYHALASVHLHICNCICDSVMHPLSDFLPSGISEQFSATHYIDEDMTPVRGIHNFITLLRVLSSPQYRCFYSGQIQSEDGSPLSSANNFIYASKHDHTGAYSMDIIYLNSETSFTVLANLQDESILAFTDDFSKRVQPHRYPLKSTHVGLSNIDAVIALYIERLLLEERHEEIEIRPDFPFKILNPTVIARILDRSSFEIPAEKLAAFYKIHENRRSSFFRRNKPYTLLFSAEGMENLRDRAELTGWAQGLSPFRPEELRSTVGELLVLAQQNPNIQFRLLKQEINYNHYIYNLYGTSALSLCDSKQYNSKQYYSCTVKSAPLVEGFSQFIKNYLLPHCTYSSEESLAFLQDFHASL